MENLSNIIKTIIDIGNSRIKVLMGELYDNGQKVRVLAYGEVDSEGIKKSKIEDPDALGKAIESAVGKVREKTDIPITEVIVGIGSADIKSKTISGRTTFDESYINDKHIEEFFKVAEKEAIKPGEVIIKKEIYNIRVNNSGIVREPKGILGKEIQGDVHFICLEEKELNIYEEVVNRAGFGVEKIVLNCEGAAEAVLDSEEIEKGVALIDIGEGITDVLMYKNDKLIYSKSIPLGAMHYINDLSYILEIPREEAVDLLKKFKERKEKEKELTASNKKKFTVSYIKNIIDARTGDITKFIIDTIEESGFNGYLGRGVVLTGGATIIDELVGKIISETGYRVTYKVPPSLRGLEKVDSSMSSVIGIFLKSLKDEIIEFERKNEEKKEENKEIINNNTVNENMYENNINISSVISDTERKEIILEENEPVEKKNVFKPIFDWLSNYI